MRSKALRLTVSIQSGSASATTKPCSRTPSRLVPSSLATTSIQSGSASSFAKATADRSATANRVAERLRVWFHHHSRQRPSKAEALPPSPRLRRTGRLPLNRVAERLRVWFDHHTRQRPSKAKALPPSPRLRRTGRLPLTVYPNAFAFGSINTRGNVHPKRKRFLLRQGFLLRRGYGGQDGGQVGYG